MSQGSERGSEREGGREPEQGGAVGAEGTAARPGGRGRDAARRARAGRREEAHDAEETGDERGAVRRPTAGRGVARDIRQSAASVRQTTRQVAARAGAMASAVGSRVSAGVEDRLERLALRLPERSPSDDPARRASALRAARGEVDWTRVGVFGAGVALGALIGAGVALLVAPASGDETRARLARQSRRTRRQLADRWEDAADSVRLGARRSTREARRALLKGRWAAEEAIRRR